MKKKRFGKSIGHAKRNERATPLLTPGNRLKQKDG